MYRLCEICGNEIDAEASRCPFCDAEQKPPAEKTESKKRVPKVLVVNLKEGQPTVMEAMNRLESKIATSRSRGNRVIKFIHGYGSTGEGGAIRIAALDRFAKLKLRGEIKNFLTGEDHFQYAGSRNYLLNKYPELKDTWSSDRGNKGITFVEL